MTVSVPTAVSAPQLAPFTVSPAIPAMATGIVAKAKSVAFQRDMRLGTRTGMTRADIKEAVAITYRENKDVEHTYAIKEFMDRQSARLEEMAKAEIAGTGKSVGQLRRQTWT